MKQVLQNMATGETTLVAIPAPMPQRGTVLVQSACSLISAGTERMLVDFGRASLLEKVRQQPDKVKQVLQKVKTDGLLSTIDAVRSKLAQPLPLGYCNVGIVQEVGNGVDGLRIGDRVASNGPHASVVRVPHHLCAKIPDGVSDDCAAFTVVASIGLQGIRLAAPTLGEAFVVIGAGLIGLLTVQLLRAHGCAVLAVDLDERKLELAAQFGAAVCNPARGEDPLAAAAKLSKGRGVDGVIIAASSKSSDIVSQAAQMCRVRGRIVLVGVTGLELNRAEFYAKELSFQVSCSYGPGRYDPNYEEGGIDYPFGFVRWTEQRNFEAVLDMMASGQLDVQPLLTHRFLFDDAPAAYQALTEDKSALGILLQYPAQQGVLAERTIALSAVRSFNTSHPVIGGIGAGNYASRVLLPAFKAAGAQCHTLVTTSGTNAVTHGRAAGFGYASTDMQGMLSNADINTVVIATRHDSHASLVTQALKAGKHVFVEKPLAITEDELGAVRRAFDGLAAAGKPCHLMVGFNRRFAPQIVKMKALLASVHEPKSFVMTINAGAIPASHWTQDRALGGGRIIGEACHFIDLMRHLADSPIISMQARRMGNAPSVAVSEDKASITLGFADGSFGTIHYLANGAASFPKERIEVFVAGRVLQLDNFRQLKGFGWPGFRRMNLWRQDKGQAACVAAFLEALRLGNSTPIPAEQVFEVAEATIKVAQLLRTQ